MKNIKYYLVGGAVRDQLLGLKAKDLDYAVEAESFEAMEAWITANGGTIFLSKPEFFTSRAKVPGHVDAADYVLCRKEGDYRDGRRPDSVSMGTIFDDLARRDFTVNAMALNMDTQELVDPFNGQEDLDSMILTCVGNTEERFNEDHLRILRAVRFHITKGFYFDDDINSYLQVWENVEKLKKISKERIYEELRKCYEFDCWETVKFFKEFDVLHDAIFDPHHGCGIKLSPRI